MSETSSAEEAFADIRLAEAGRLLGVLDTSTLGDRAAGWLAAGIDTGNVAALAQSSRDAGGIRLALVAEVASEFGIRFASLQDARRLYSEHILAAMSTGASYGADITALSNGYTDELIARIRSFFGGLLRRHG